MDIAVRSHSVVAVRVRAGVEPVPCAAALPLPQKQSGGTPRRPMSLRFHLLLPESRVTSPGSHAAAEVAAGFARSRAPAQTW
jgi:hypothetical protein